MAKWQEYEAEAAALFRSLDLEATTGECLVDVRGAHDVDVVVRSQRAGLQQLWVVECKRHKRRVGKVHVAALAEIVSDVGADRGLLLSEVGFQSGAHSMAEKSNVTLTCLTDLRTAAAVELRTLRLGECRVRLAHLHERLGAVGHRQRHGPTGSLVSYRTAPGHWDIIKLHAAIGIAEEGLRSAEMDRWPAPYAWDFTSDDTYRASDVESFIDGLTGALIEVEAELVVLEEANPQLVRPCRGDWCGAASALTEASAHTFDGRFKGSAHHGWRRREH